MYRKGDRVEVLQQVKPDVWTAGKVTNFYRLGNHEYYIVQFDSGVVVTAISRHVRKEKA